MVAQAITNPSDRVLKDKKLVSKVKKYIQLTGVELEFWSDEDQYSLLKNSLGCNLVEEAGKNLFEVYTVPYVSVEEAFTALRETFGEIGNNNYYFTASRPPEFVCNRLQWSSKKRHNAAREALENVRPGHADQVNQMTEFAALQGNFSGEKIEVLGESGTFLVNSFNWLAPGIAYLAHKDLGYGKGHLAIWQEFAEPERLPSSGRWFASADEMIAYIQSLPKLISEEENTIAPYIKVNQTIDCPTDLTCMWWFMRPKISQFGGMYLESRYLPSMPFDKAEKYLQQTSEIIEVLLDWFFGPNDGQAVPSREEAEPAFRFLADKLPAHDIYVPRSENEWLDLFNNY